MHQRFWPALALAFLSTSCLESPDDLQTETEDEVRKENGGPNGDADYCLGTITCASGEGDCDSNAQCNPGLTCANNIGAQFGMPGDFDVCVQPHCTNGTQDLDETGKDCGGADCGTCNGGGGCVGANGDAGFCTAGCPCTTGQGDCDGDTQCATGLVCANDRGAAYGQLASNDVCVPTTCTNSQQDPGETGVDCGGTCGGSCLGRVRSTNGSAVALTSDNQYAVAVHRTSAGRHSVNIMRLDLTAVPPTVARDNSLIFESTAAEPVAVVIANDDNTAYVVLRATGQVQEITNLRTAPALGRVVNVGSEPAGIAISPSGASLYVTNWADGTVSVIRTADLTVRKTIDLNIRLRASGLIGSSPARAALAHPYAIVMTNDGDNEDNDETIYVTEFFSQQRRTGVPASDAAFDENRIGLLYRIAASTDNAVGQTTLAPISDTGFLTSTGATTGCFPNQLYAAAINNNRLYVTAVCASPRGPAGGAFANFKTEVHAGIFVVDIATNLELTAQRNLLTQRYQALYDAEMVTDDATRRIPLIPNDIAFVPGSSSAYVTGYGSDALFKIEYAADGSFVRVGSAAARFVNLAPGGRLPLGVAVSANGLFAAVANEFTRSLSIVNLSTDAAVASAEIVTPAPTGLDAEINLGRRFFVTGLGRWSLNGQGWNSCEACHPNGMTDNISWFFARGPRQTTSLDGTYDSLTGERRVLNWTGIFDELHDFELNTRGNSGGIGAIVHTVSNPISVNDRIIFDGTAPVGGQLATATPQAGLNGSTISMMPGGATAPNTVLTDWNEIDEYVRSIRSPRAPRNLNTADVAAGRQLFADGGCAGCHGTSMWTVSRVFYTPNEANNHPTTGALRLNNYVADAAFPAAVNPPSNNATRTATLRFNGANPGANDQINCVLRAVGTFPAALDAGQNGISVGGIRVREVRQDMATAAQGATGFNPPSLLAMSTGAPYFHAGNARTLEEIFDPTFAAHYQAFNATFLTGAERTTQIRQLVAFLVSLDETTPAVDVPNTLGFNPLLCPTSF